ncbi:MAG: sugar-binding transcriptional regulator [Bacteroidales bacterium]|nr:sugar-binding transcriptional regulator [Bacteroidales bacterium]
MSHERIIYKVVRAYYEDGLTQQEIGSKYGISRIKVSRMLSRALEDKIVQIKIGAPTDKYHNLEHKLESKYGIKEVVVVDTGRYEQDEVFASIGRAAAGYLIANLQGNEIIGLTWGRTLLNLVNALGVDHFPELQVVQMLGGLGEPEAGYHGADLTRRMAEKLSTKPRLIHAPGIVRSGDLCRELIDDIQVSNTLQLAARADIALVGLGLFGPDSPICKSDHILSGEDKNLLGSLNVVGDISFRFFDDQGHYVASEIDKRIVGLSADEIGKIPRIIGVAGGENKYRVIRAALKGNLIHVLITDNFTAEKLANENN